MSCPRLSAFILIATGIFLFSAPGSLAAKKPAAAAKSDVKAAADPQEWKDLFDGKSLKGWKAIEFGGEGKVYVKDGSIVMDKGAMMTGIVWTGDVVRNNYELTLEGMRLDGDDFFCTTTFPVGKDPCTLVVGGWGGMIVGLSNVDYFDASENSTTTSKEFKTNRWYKVRLRVSDAAIEAWIDGEKMIEQPRAGHAFTIRMEVEECKPLGISTWSTKGAVRNIRLRSLKPDEVKKITADIKAAHKDE